MAEKCYYLSHSEAYKTIGSLEKSQTQDVVTEVHNQSGISQSYNSLLETGEMVVICRN